MTGDELVSLFDCEEEENAFEEDALLDESAFGPPKREDMKLFLFSFFLPAAEARLVLEVDEGRPFEGELFAGLPFLPPPFSTRVAL